MFFVLYCIVYVEHDYVLKSMVLQIRLANLLIESFQLDVTARNNSTKNCLDCGVTTYHVGKPRSMLK